MSKYKIKPFLKWAGGKQKLLNYILPNLPTGKKLIEPFLGAGAVFLNTQYSHYLLGDNNLDLINLYRHLQEDGKPFINFCETFFIPENNEKNKFYQLRDLFNATQDAHLKSALFIYFNRHGYNGLCRYNSSGIFNVPFGSYKNPQFPHDAIKNFLKMAKKAKFQHADFMTTMQQARKGDVIYCDPPYVPLSKTANFTKYSMSDFNKDNQLQLVHEAERLAKKGITIVISNHYTEFTKQLYRNAKIITFEVQRFISRDVNNRTSSMELLAVFS